MELLGPGIDIFSTLPGNAKQFFKVVVLVYTLLNSMSENPTSNSTTSSTFGLDTVFVRAAITKYHKLGGLNNRNILSQF